MDAGKQGVTCLRRDKLQGEGHEDEVGGGEFKCGDVRLFDADVGDAGAGNVGSEAVGHRR